MNCVIQINNPFVKKWIKIRINNQFVHKIILLCMYLQKRKPYNDNEQINLYQEVHFYEKHKQKGFGIAFGFVGGNFVGRLRRK